MSYRLDRLVAAVHSPFGENGELHTPAVEAQAHRLLQTGVHGVFACGTTGECSSMTNGERIALAQTWCQVARGTKLEVVVHVGGSCQKDSIELARAAEKAGAHALAAVSPSYLKPGTVDDLIDFLTPVAAAAPSLPFYFYDIPPLTGVHLSMVAFLEKAPQKIPQLAGLKYSNPDLPQLIECLNGNEGAFEVLFGIDEALLAVLALGVKGAVGSSYNFAAPIYHRLIAAFFQGDLETARKEQAQSVRLVRLLGRFGYLAGAKHIMGLLGAPVGEVRAPVRGLSNESKKSLERELHETGLFHAIQK